MSGNAFLSWLYRILPFDKSCHKMAGFHLPPINESVYAIPHEALILSSLM